MNRIIMPKVKPLPYPIQTGNIVKRTWCWICYTRKWALVEDWYFTLYNGDIIMIPEGFESDGASVPKPFRNIISPVGPMFLGGLIHDYAYRYDKLIGVSYDEEGNVVLYEYHPGAGKLFWDKVFMNVGKQVSGLRVISFVAWGAVRVGGFIAWRGYRKVFDPSLFLV